MRCGAVRSGVPVSELASERGLVGACSDGGTEWGRPLGEPGARKDRRHEDRSAVSVSAANGGQRDDGGVSHGSREPNGRGLSGCSNHLQLQTRWYGPTIET